MVMVVVPTRMMMRMRRRSTLGFLLCLMMIIVNNNVAVSSAPPASSETTMTTTTTMIPYESPSEIRKALYDKQFKSTLQAAALSLISSRRTNDNNTVSSITQQQLINTHQPCERLARKPVAFCGQAQLLAARRTGAGMSPHEEAIPQTLERLERNARRVIDKTAQAYNLSATQLANAAALVHGNVDIRTWRGGCDDQVERLLNQTRSSSSSSINETWARLWLYGLPPKSAIAKACGKQNTTTATTTTYYAPLHVIRAPPPAMVASHETNEEAESRRRTRKRWWKHNLPPPEASSARPGATNAVATAVGANAAGAWKMVAACESGAIVPSVDDDVGVEEEEEREEEAETKELMGVVEEMMEGMFEEEPGVMDATATATTTASSCVITDDEGAPMPLLRMAQAEVEAGARGAAAAMAMLRRGEEEHALAQAEDDLTPLARRVRDAGATRSPISPAAFTLVARWADEERLHLVSDDARSGGAAEAGAEGQDEPTRALRAHYMRNAADALLPEVGLAAGPIAPAGRALPAHHVASPYGGGYVVRAVLAELCAERLDALGALAGNMRAAQRASARDGLANERAQEWERRARMRWQERVK